MVAKISHGMSLYGALAYNYEKVAAGTAEILSGNRMISISISSVSVWMNRGKRSAMPTSIGVP